ncbi:hypothetical protein MRX96_015159 [Rhipicephalus microplus]
MREASDEEAVTRSRLRLSGRRVNKEEGGGECHAERDLKIMFAVYEDALHQRRVEHVYVLEEIDAAERERGGVERMCWRLGEWIFWMCSIERQSWVYPAGQSWYETKRRHLTECEFGAQFRVTRQTFRYILNVCECMERQDSIMRKALHLHKCVAVGLYRLASSAEELSLTPLA